MSRLTPRRTSLLFPVVLSTLVACQDSTAPRPLAQPKVQFAQGDNNTWTVNSLADPGVGVCDETECTLREAISAAAAFGKIVFASGLEGPIMLGTGQPLQITKALTIDGAGRITVDGMGASRVMSVSGTGVKIDVNLVGLTLTKGAADNDRGAGLLVQSASLALDNVKVKNNFANQGSGGGIYLEGSDATITASAISFNFVGNSVSGEFVGLGGGIYLDGNSELTLVNSTVDHNNAGGFLGVGGGIFNDGTLTIKYSTISDNVSTKGGAGLLNGFDDVAHVVGSTFSGNTAATEGGGGIYNVGAIELRSSTVTRNTGTVGIAGGIHGVGVTNVVNSIVAGNSGSDCSGTIASLGHNLTVTGSGCPVNGSDVVVQASQVFSEVLEQDLKDNGGPTMTHALIARGRAIDKGYCPGEAADQRGFVRPVDDPVMPNALDACDIGAYEIQGPVAAVADLMISQTVDKPSAKQGDRVTYTIRVQNLGPQTAPNVEVNDILSSGVTFVEAKANKGSLKAPPVGENGTVTWTLGDMLNGANETATIAVTVIIKGKTMITNIASVSGAVADPNSANNSSSIAVSVGSGGSTRGGRR